ncbi:lipopolysaccharide heptosyltransferase II [Cupriavidus agavae]|uniref:lipopolysaccharide heptosyltransferase II n=1 Tax=Cupriavidus agavae TaxID=1001822 RepID=A0A4Q7S9K0_9BURK|nr:lipopolysaccharide heptosyltransferase II [Cupriavidus agavae]RZT42480.1 lipopolysaccharide heptosyltransferase II [Cupriavidus agavae]
MSTAGSGAGWEQARRVLCVRLDNMGDVLMTTPALQALADSLPGRELTLLTSRPCAALAPHLPMVADVMTWDAPWVRHDPQPGTREVSDGIAACAARLAARSFDAAVIFTVYSQSPLPAAILCCMAGIPLRLAHCRENPYALLSDWVRDTEPNLDTHRPPRHEAQRQLDLVAQVGAATRDPRLRFRLAHADRDSVAALLRQLGARRHVVVHPGATAPSRRWPPERFAAVARQLADESGALVLVTGSAGEAGIVAQVCALAGRAGVVPLAGRLSLGEMGALLASADLLVSNNSGPVHLAAALGTPVADLYALTNPQHTPWMVPHRVLFHDVPCRYCYKSACPQGHHRCLREVTVEQVLDAARALLAGEACETAMPWHPPAAAAAPSVPAVPAAPGLASDTPPFAEETAHVHTWH